MGMEYRMDDVIEALSSDDPVSSFFNDQGLHLGLMNYCVHDCDSLSVRINEEITKGNKNCLHGLVAFLPMTYRIIEQLVIDNNILKDVIDRCEFAGVLERCFNKFTNLFGSDVSNLSGKISDISNAISNYQEEITKHEERIANYKENMKNEKELHDKLLVKEKELSELELEWGPEVINEKIQKADEEIRKRREEKKKAEKKLRELGQQLDKTEHCNDNGFMKRMKAFNDVIKELPKDVSEL